MAQWREELTGRFGLNVTAVWPHQDLLNPRKQFPADLVVIDEADQVVAPAGSDPGREQLARAARQRAHSTRHLLLLSATPVRQRDEELLQLLHLLDRDRFDPRDVEGFRERLRARADRCRPAPALDRPPAGGRSRCRRAVCRTAPPGCGGEAHAHGVGFLDLAFGPMNLEQQVGRVDRLGRTADVPCLALLTHPDHRLALDAAWYLILRDGFGLFRESAADVLLLLQQELVRLREQALFHGPGGLAAQAARVRERVERERAATDDQDVIDGLDLGDPTATGLWRDLERAESPAAVAALRTGCRVAWDRFLGQRTTPTADPQTDAFAAGEAVPPALRECLPGRATADRATALAHSDLAFLRPGQPFVDRLRDRVADDDRGRAWALWRPRPGRANPVVAFRAAVFVGPDLNRLDQELNRFDCDPVARSALRQLVAGWLTPRLQDVVLDEGGAVADAGLADLCRLPFDPGRDGDLGGAAAAVLAGLFRPEPWGRLCAEAARDACAAALAEEVFRREHGQALEDAAEHFRATLARHRDRPDTRAAEGALRDLVLGLLRAPVARLDALGAYLLSDHFPDERGD